MRESKQIDLKTISQHTKISATMLEALEEENFKILPKKAYMRGFVKSFVKTLGGDQKEAIRILEETHRYYFPEEYQTSEEEDGEIFQGPEISSPNIIKSVLLGLGFLAIIAVVVFLVVSQQAHKGNQETQAKETSTQEKDKTQSEKTEVTNVSPRSINPDTPLKTATPSPKKEQADKEQKEVATEDPEEKPREDEKSEEKEKKEKEEEKEEKVSLRPITRDLFSYADVDHQAQVEEHIPEQMRTVVPNKENLFIRATDGDTWLAYKGDDEAIKRFTLREGEFIQVRANTIRIFFGNVKATKLFLNNKLLVTPSRTGVKSLVFPEEKKEQFMLPLFIFKDNGEVITSEEYQKRQQQED